MFPCHSISIGFADSIGDRTEVEVKVGKDLAANGVEENEDCALDEVIEVEDLLADVVEPYAP